MAGASLLALLDDIAMILDDVAVLSKVALKKTAGVVGDDLALSADQVTGLNANRELPVIWKVAKGSSLNKAILVPLAIILSTFAPWAVLPLLMAGGLYLCFEGAEKLVHKLLHSKAEDDAAHAAHVKALVDENVDMVAFENEKIKGAIRTDFILSAEILIIALSTVADQPLAKRILVLCTVAVFMTIVVYGLVALIVKMDDAGLHLMQQQSSAKKRLGRLLVAAAPPLLKTLSVLGTLAMFMVGGSILLHGIAPWHHAVEHFAHSFAGALGLGGTLPLLVALSAEALFGLAAGLLCVALFVGGKKAFGKSAH
jgi:uncharacterized protein